MSEAFAKAAIVGNDNPDADLAEKIGTFVSQLGSIADEMAKAKNEDTARYNELHTEAERISSELAPLKEKFETEKRDTDAKALSDEVSEWREYVARSTSKAHYMGQQGPTHRSTEFPKGKFLFAVHEANGRDYERQTAGKAMLAEMASAAPDPLDDWFQAADSNTGGLGKAYTYENSWGKATLGTTDPTGGWIIPNAIVDTFIKPAQITDIYRQICTVVDGVTAFAVDIPFRSAVRNRAVIAAFGATKENVDLAYNGYTATMYTLARIHDVSNQFLRQSSGAAEQDIMQELAAAFAQGEAFYIREGTGTSQPFGYTPALTNGPAAFRTAFTPSATTLAGSIASAIALDAGVLAGRGVHNGGGGIAAVLSATSYWLMISQGTDTAGFFFNPSGGPTAINAPAGTLISPFGIPVYADADADLDSAGSTTVTDNLVVGDWKQFKVYFGQSYRVDSSDQAGTRWDTNLTGFRGEEEMGFDARPAVYAGYFQLNTDITP